MDTPSDPAPRLFLIDAYALVYRSYFAFIRRPLTNARGENTSAPFGFANFLHSIRDEHGPDYLAVVFDAGRSHREELYPQYKATRAKMPEELRDSLPRVRELVAAFGDEAIELDGWEADDVIGTLARRAAEAGLEAVIVSGDKDFYQLLGDRVRLLNPGRGGPHGVGAAWVDREGASSRFGVEPDQVVDYLALVGDSSDNVPGAPGIGPKTAAKLLAQHGTVERLLDAAADIKAKRPRESLLANRDAVLLSKKLVTIRTDLPLDVEIEQLRVSEPDEERLRALYAELEFSTLLDRLDRGRAGGAAGARGGEAAGTAPGSGAAGTGAGRGEEAGPTAAAPPASHVLVTDPAELPAIARACRAAGRMAVAVLTGTLDPMRGQVAGIAVAAEPDRAYYLPFAHGASMSLGLGDVPGEAEPDAPDNLPPLRSAALEPIRSVLADPAVAKVGHDLKRSVMGCRRAGLELSGSLLDVMVASYVLDPGRRRQDLAALSSHFLGTELPTPASVLGTGKNSRAFGDVEAGKALDFACGQVIAGLRMWDLFAARLAAQGLEELFRDLEIPLIPVLAEMEMHGVRIDAGFFAGMSARLGAELGQVRREIFLEAGEEFNLNSTPQLREVLFGALGLPVQGKTKTGPSTGAAVLEKLAALEGHPGARVPRLLLEYRQLEKLRGTYVDALPALVNPETGRIHTTFNQAVAATGRLSSSDPNLQNIPIRTELGREVRRGFTAPEGRVLMTADYSQIELRILAHFSGDEVFVRAFREGKDVHRETAAVIFGTPVDEVTREMRYQAKTVNFATLYGQGPFGLKQQLGISQAEAREFIAQYFERFAGVRRFLDEQVELAEARGYAVTLLGRRRQVPELRARARHVREFGKRVAQNTPIQGTAADLIKVAMIRLGRELGPSSGARMLLQVHDELVFEVDGEAVESVAALVAKVMESAVELAVPLRVDVGTGATWYDCKG